MGGSAMASLGDEIIKWVDDNRSNLSDWNQTIWNFAETVWREERSAAWYVARLREEGFDVEEGSGGMPTAFSARWSNGDGPSAMTYAEYDAVPGNCQKADTYRAPREGLSRFAGGHTDPHSALGMSGLGGLLATKAVMQKHNIQGTLRFMGEPAEKVRGSKPIHAAKGYYDGLDGIVSFHPFYMLPLSNTCRWETHCGPYYGVIYEFLCEEPESWLAGVGKSSSGNPIPAAHTMARAPGANDAVTMMFTLGKSARDHMLPHSGTWTVNETILVSGQATADNLPAQMAQIMYAMRAPSREMLDRILAVLDRTAEAAALASHCTVNRHWVSKSRPGLANHAMAQRTFDHLTRVGAPRFNGDAITSAHAIQKELGLKPIEKPFIEAIETLMPPQEAERLMRAEIPSWQTHYTSDDYTDMTWHAPTVRLYIGRPALKAPDGFSYADWVMNALGGIRSCIDPMIMTASKTIGLTLLDVINDAGFRASTREEFNTRTEGGVGGKNWEAPWCDYPAPIEHPWPRYIQTSRGYEWWIPETSNDRAMHR